MVAWWPILLNASLAQCLPQDGETYKCYFNWEGFLTFLEQRRKSLFLVANQHRVFVKNNGTQPRWPRLASRMNGLRKTNNFLISTQSREFSTITAWVRQYVFLSASCLQSQTAVSKNYWARREINIGENDLFRVGSSPGGDNDDDDASPWRRQWLVMAALVSCSQR